MRTLCILLSHRLLLPSASSSLIIAKGRPCFDFSQNQTRPLLQYGRYTTFLSIGNDVTYWIAELMFSVIVLRPSATGISREKICGIYSFKMDEASFVLVVRPGLV